MVYKTIQVSEINDYEVMKNEYLEKGFKIIYENYNKEYVQLIKNDLIVTIKY